MESFSIAPPGGGSRSRKSDDPLLGRCDTGAVAAGVRFHHWGLGFRQYSFRPITRASQDGTVNAFGGLLLLWHAVFPSSFRLQVNQMAQKPPSKFLLTASGIQHRVPRRTLLSHPAFQGPAFLARDYPRVRIPFRFHRDCNHDSGCWRPLAAGRGGYLSTAGRLPSASLRPVAGFPDLRLLWRLRRCPGFIGGLLAAFWTASHVHGDGLCKGG